MQETSATPISTPSTPTSTSWEKLDKPTLLWGLNFINPSHCAINAMARTRRYLG